MNTGTYPGAPISVFGIGLGWREREGSFLLYSRSNQINPAASYIVQILLPSGTVLQPLSGLMALALIFHSGLSALGA